jgi:hypothetical protein
MNITKEHSGSMYLESCDDSKIKPISNEGKTDNFTQTRAAFVYTLKFYEKTVAIARF